MATVWRTRIPGILDRFDNAVALGLVAAAQVVKQTVSSELRLGYTTGKYVTPHVALSVAATEPERAGAKWRIQVGTNVMYALYWELGFHLVAWGKPTGRFMRREIWVPALHATRNLQASEFAKIVKRVLTR